MLPQSESPFLRKLPRQVQEAHAPDMIAGAAASASHMLASCCGSLMLWHAADESLRCGLPALDAGEPCTSTQVPLPPGRSVRMVAAGTFHALALDDAGDVHGVGRTQAGQLGTHAAEPLLLPAPLPHLPREVRARVK